jgi:hypothetical protein
VNYTRGSDGVEAEFPQKQITADQAHEQLRQHLESVDPAWERALTSGSSFTYSEPLD